MNRSRMFLKLALRSAWMRPGRALIAILALVVAAAVTTAVLALYSDAQSKLQQQFRSYGANIIVSTNDGSSLPADAVSRTSQIVGPEGVVIAYAYAVARADGRPVIVAGTDLGAVRRLNTWWSVTHWPNNEESALVGKRIFLNSTNGSVDLVYAGKPSHLKIAGILSTGGEEDNGIYLDLKTFTAWTGLQPSTLEIYVPGPAQLVTATVSRLSAEFPHLRIAPVHAIANAEAGVLRKTRSTFFAATIIIAVTSLLCLLATLTAAALQRSRDFALMKALGASQLVATAMLGFEAAALGAIGGIIGYVAGILLAEVIARLNFQAGLTPHFQLLPEILLGSIVASLIAAAAPMSFLRRVQPAVVLKGE